MKAEEYLGECLLSKNTKNILLIIPENKPLTMIKKILLSLVTLMFTLTAWGQLVTASQLENLRTQMFGNTKDYKKIALSIRNNLTLGNDGAMTNSKIVEIPGWTQSELFEMTKIWVLNNVKDNEVQIDKGKGCIIVRCSVENVVKRNDYALANDISLRPLLRLDFKEGRVRITCSQDSYSATISRQFFGLVPKKNHQLVTWKIRNCYPFVNKSTAYITKKKVTSKAFVMAYLSAIHYITVLEDYLLHFSAFYQTGYMCV